MTDSRDIVERHPRFAIDLHDEVGRMIARLNASCDEDTCAADVAVLSNRCTDAAALIERLDAALSEAEARGRALGLEEAIRICMRAPSCRASWRMPETPSAFPLSWPIGWPRTPWARER